MREETMIEAINDIDSIRCMVEDIHEEITNTTDYWTRLEHQAAIAAMQGMLSGKWVDMLYRVVENDGQYHYLLTNKAQELAHALVEKLKSSDL